VTRLSQSMVTKIGSELKSYDEKLHHRTGHTVKEVAYRGAVLLKMRPLPEYRPRVAVIPVSTGQGIIRGFSEAVRDIVDYLGFPSYVTAKPDVTGLAQAVEEGAEILFLADDNCFVAVNVERRFVVNNKSATAAGYAAALDYGAGGLRGKKVLIIGAGEIGKTALKIIKNMGARVGVYDIDISKAELAAAGLGATVERNLDEALHGYRSLYDASPAADIIDTEHIRPETRIAACGIPMGITAEACSILGDRVIHDPLQIGVATMMMASTSEKLEGG